MKAKANGIEIYYELHGSEGAPWLVLSHSLACTARMWDPQIEAFKGSHRILAYDIAARHNTMCRPEPLSVIGQHLRGHLDALPPQTTCATQRGATA